MIKTIRRVAGSMLPREWRLLLRDLRSLSPTQRRIYMRRRRAARKGLPLPSGLTPESRIVFICYGNILRSPMAEALYRKELESRGLSTVGVSSAGVAAANPPREAHRDGRAIAPSFGVSLEGHKSTLLTHHIVRDAQLLVVMDHLHEAMLLDKFPEAETRTVPLGIFDPDVAKNGIPIDDPYGFGEGVAGQSYSRIARAVTVFVAAVVGSERQA